MILTQPPPSFLHDVILFTVFFFWGRPSFWNVARNRVNIATLWLHPTPNTHTPGIVVSTCSWLVMTCSNHVNDYITSSWILHDLFIPFSWLATFTLLFHDLFMICSRLCLWLLHYLFMTCLWLIHDFFMACLWLLQNFLKTSLLPVEDLLPTYLQTRISGPYGPLKILVPAESLLALLTSSSSPPSTSSTPPPSLI